MNSMRSHHDGLLPLNVNSMFLKLPLVEYVATNPDASTQRRGLFGPAVLRLQLAARWTHCSWASGEDVYSQWQAV